MPELIRKIKPRRVRPKPVVTNMSTVSQQQIDMGCNTSTENEPSQQILRSYWYHFHRRYWITSATKSKSHDLLIARVLAVLIWLYIIIIKFLAYSNLIQSSTVAINFLYLACYPWNDICSIVYASGAAAYGTSIEIYLIIPFTIINSVLAILNCSIHHSETIGSIINIFKVTALFIATELTHQNFKRFTYQHSYQLHHLTATRAMFRQSVYLVITIMFLVSPGLRAAYNAARFKCPYGSKMDNISYCSLIDIEQPRLEHSDSCVADYTALVTSIEQLRIIRDIALCSIAFYSMYNKAFLDITGKSGIIHKIVLTLFIAMSSSFIAANIDPFQFNKFKLFFILIEMIIFITVIILLIINLRKKCEHRNQVIMEANPTIFG